MQGSIGSSCDCDTLILLMIRGVMSSFLPNGIHFFPTVTHHDTMKALINPQMHLFKCNTKETDMFNFSNMPHMYICDIPLTVNTLLLFAASTNSLVPPSISCTTLQYTER